MHNSNVTFHCVCLASNFQSTEQRTQWLQAWAVIYGLSYETTQLELSCFITWNLSFVHNSMAWVMKQNLNKRHKSVSGMRPHFADVVGTAKKWWKQCNCLILNMPLHLMPNLYGHTAKKMAVENLHWQIQSQISNALFLSARNTHITKENGNNNSDHVPMSNSFKRSSSSSDILNVMNKTASECFTKSLQLLDNI